MKQCNFVVTQALYEKLSGKKYLPATPYSKPGILSYRISFSLDDCKTEFGRWLAERILTTRRDDDLSILSITLKKTEMDISFACFADKFKLTSLKQESNLTDLEHAFQNWIAEQKQWMACYGDLVFSNRVIEFDWPVLGSRAADGIENPARYFDFCAGKIRHLKPAAIRTRMGEAPPDSFQIC